MPIRLRRLKPTDTDLGDLAAQLNTADWEATAKNFSAKSLAKFTADPDRFYLLAFREGQIVGATHGYLLLHPTGVRYLYVDEVDTMVGHRRQGVATAMMNETFAIARQLGASEVWLGTEDDNIAAKALYQSLKPSEIENGPIYTYKLADHGQIDDN